MKTYYYQNKNNFIYETLDELKLFDLYLHNEISHFFKKAEIDLLTAKGPLKVFRQDVSAPLPWMEKYGVQSHGIRFSEMLPYKPLRVNTTEYTIDYERPGPLEFTIIREDHIRNLYTPAIYLYVNIPYTFIKNNMTSNLDHADLKKYYRVFNNFPDADLKRIVHLWREGDTRYTEKVTFKENQPKVPKWRVGMFCYMHYTVSKFGYGYPVMLNDSTQLFYDGSHRLCKSAAVQRDYPLLIGINPHSKIIDDNLLAITPPWFKNNQIALFSINYKNKDIHGWFLDKETTRKFTDIKIPWNQKPGHITDSEYLKKLFYKLEEKPSDFNFKFKE